MGTIIALIDNFLSFSIPCFVTSTVQAVSVIYRKSRRFFVIFIYGMLWFRCCTLFIFYITSLARFDVV